MVSIHYTQKQLYPSRCGKRRHRITTWSSRRWKSISPSNSTRCCFLARMSIPTSLFDIFVYASNNWPKVMIHVLSGRGWPSSEMTRHSSTISALMWSPACRPRSSVKEPSTGFPYSGSSFSILARCDAPSQSEKGLMSCFSLCSSARFCQKETLEDIWPLWLWAMLAVSTPPAHTVRSIVNPGKPIHSYKKNQCK